MTNEVGEEIRIRAVELQRRLSETKIKAEEVGIAIAELNESVVIRQNRRRNKAPCGIRGLQERAASVERSLDIATTAAVLEGLRQTIANRERAEKEAIEKLVNGGPGAITSTRPKHSCSLSRTKPSLGSLASTDHEPP